jgi:hypothetical protein
MDNGTKFVEVNTIMKIRISTLFLLLFVGLSSCIEIIDDLTLNADGSGTFKYHINLSSSKVKVNSILALDSLNGRKVPSLEEIKSRIEKVSQQLRSQHGITSVEVDANYTDFILKLSFDFTSLEALQEGVKTVIKAESGDKQLTQIDHEWVSFENNQLKRSIPQITLKQSKELDEADRDLLKTGTYTSITRFGKEIGSFENKDAMLSKNKRAILLKTDPYTLMQRPDMLDNTIYLIP